MIQELVQLFIDGAMKSELVPFIEEVELEEHVDSADVFRVRLSLSPGKDGIWKHLDEKDFQVWNAVSLVAGYTNDPARLMDGQITHIDFGLSGPSGGGAYLEISGMDYSALMDLDAKEAAWPNKSDSQIAEEIFRRYGLTPVVENTEPTHREAASTRLQSDTDIRFLRMLAARRGFECFVQGTKGYFRNPDLSSTPQPVLAIEFGSDTNLISVQVSVDATAPTVVESRRIDPFAKAVRGTVRTELPRRRLGKRSLHELRPPSSRRLHHRYSAGLPEDIDAEVVAAYEPAGQFVILKGEVDSRAYRHVLRAKRLVTVKGIGQLYSGLYYVRRVRHHFTVGGYTQSFEATRNALGPLGSEKFTSDARPAAATLLPLAFQQLAGRT